MSSAAAHLTPVATQLKPATAHAAPAVRHRAQPQNFLIAFYGFGGTGFPNSWVSTIADDAGAVGGYIVRKYQETDESKALSSLLKSMDLNSDHVISTAEIGAATVRVLGYSFGGIAGANLTRDLTNTRKAIAGYKLAAAVPVKALVDIDPVNYTGLRHTDGPVGNVEKFVSYYQLNPTSGSSIALTNRTTGQSAGTASFNEALLPVGGPLSSKAQRTTQSLVDFGSWADQVVTHRYTKSLNGTMSGGNVNHSTMPWYCYPFAVKELTG